MLIIEKLQERFKSDAEFRSIVLLMENFMSDNRISPQELKDAIFIAALRIENSGRGIMIHTQEWRKGKRAFQ